ncbi:Misato Segment II tubulin-like domain [Macleaya cordata]|uniref:Misato Segment II tubulin-like domain n=1 Tax=Macleaya cordata TaxID=56857 RepID=A0A200QJ83_MACCD|nr:Misato Segment II tubulin-like domain [Macleaya cordata]
MREIVTIQVGGFANFIGSHYWNFQDELLGLADGPLGNPVFRNQSLDMDVLYRAGETPQGILTYTPRMVSIDLQGSLGSLSSRGSLYNETSVPSSVATWSGNVSQLVSEPHRKNLFLQSLYDEEQKDDPQSKVQDKDIVECLQNDVQFWTDFSKVHYHPQSLYEINGLSTNVHGFNNYGIGRDVFSEGLRGEEMNERLRFFAEECDHIQGIQFIVDDSGGFSSVAEDFLESIADEYTNIPLLLYAARDPRNYISPMSRKDSISRALHDAVSFSRLSSFCKLVVPVGLPSLSRSKVSSFLHIEDAKPFHSSAVYAAALHSVSLPFRMASLGPTAESQYVAGAVDVNGMVQMLAGQARQNMVAILDVAMPAPLTGGQNQRSFQGSLNSLTPEIKEDVEDLQEVESLTIHGALRSGGNQASISEVKDSVNAAYGSSMPRPMFSHLSVSLCPLPVPLPFPSIFGNLVGQHGELLGSPIPGSQSRSSLDVHSIPMAARLRSSSAILPFLDKRLSNLRRFGIERGAPGNQVLQNWGFGKEEVDDMGESLSKMVMVLDPYSQESSDSD